MFGVPGGQHLFVCAAIFLALRLLLKRGDGRLKVRHGVECLGAGPGLGHRAAPVGLNQADRDMNFLLQIPPKKVADGSEAVPTALSDGLRGTNAPIAFGRIDRHSATRAGSGDIRNLKQTDVGIIRRRDFCGGIVDIADAEFHVGLPGTNPDIANKNIFERDSFRPADIQRIRAACLERADFRQPLAICASNGPGFPAVEKNGHDFPRRRPTPDGIGYAALKHHVIRKQGMQEGFSVVGLHRAGQRRGSKEAEKEEQRCSQGRRKHGDSFQKLLLARHAPCAGQRLAGRKCDQSPCRVIESVRAAGHRLNRQGAATMAFWERITRIQHDIIRRGVHPDREGLLRG